MHTLLYHRVQKLLFVVVVVVVVVVDDVAVYVIGNDVAAIFAGVGRLVFAGELRA